MSVVGQGTVFPKQYGVRKVNFFVDGDKNTTLSSLSSILETFNFLTSA